MTVKRYDMVLRSRGMETWQDLEVADDGDWIKSADYDLLATENAALRKRLTEAKREAARLKIHAETYIEAFGIALRATYQSHSGHWDSKGTHGANCPECIRAQEARENCNAAIKRGLGRLAARAAESAPAKEQP